MPTEGVDFIAMSQKTKVLLVSDYLLTPAQMLKQLKHLEKHGVEFSFFQDHPDDTEEEFQERMLTMEVSGPEAVDPPAGLEKAVEDVDVLVVHFTVIPEKIINAAKNLKLIAVLRGGWENVNCAVASKRGIPVVNSPGRSGDAVSDFTVALMIAESKNLVRSSIALRQGLWQKEFHNWDYLHNMRGQTVGIIGVGEVGRRVARKLQGFDVRLLAHDPFMPDAKVREAGCEPVDLTTLLKESDFVTLHLRFTEDTRHMIDEAELALMKPSAYLVNTARAGLVNEEALIEALRKKTIGGAAIDVFQEEPLPAESPFFELDNVTLTPHLAGTSADTMRNSFIILGEELERFFKNEELHYVRNEL